jgi:hypothetical protein
VGADDGDVLGLAYKAGRHVKVPLFPSRCYGATGRLASPGAPALAHQAGRAAPYTTPVERVSSNESDWTATLLLPPEAPGITKGSKLRRLGFHR